MSVEHNNKRTLLAGVLTLGVAAIAVDRLVIGSGVTDVQSASADSFAVTPATALAASAAAWQPRRGDLAARLESLGAPEMIGDELNAFRPPADWAPAAPVVEAAPEETAPAAPTVRADQFKLGAVMTGASAMATINGHTLRPGESKGGITLLEVRELDGVATVVISTEGVRLEITPTAPLQRP